VWTSVVEWEWCEGVRRARVAFIALDGCTVDGVQRDGAQVQGFAIGQRGGGGACPVRPRVFGGFPCAGMSGRRVGRGAARVPAMCLFSVGELGRNDGED
jgi:hypothetical protein